MEDYSVNGRPQYKNSLRTEYVQEWRPFAEGQSHQCGIEGCPNEATGYFRFPEIGRHNSSESSVPLCDVCREAMAFGVKYGKQLAWAWDRGED